MVRSRRMRITTPFDTVKGREVYKRRKCVPEPVFGQIKECRGLRGLEKMPARARAAPAS